MTNKVKPFYIRITDDMTPQMVQDAFDKYVDAGAYAGDCVDEAKSKHEYQEFYEFGEYELFGVTESGRTRFYDTEAWFGGAAQEITLDQLDERLRLEAKQEWGGKGLPPVGAECEFSCDGFWGDSDYHWCRFLGLLTDKSYAIEFHHPTSPSRVTCGCFDPQCTSFRKPETPEQKAERERQYAVYDMCSDLDNHTDDARFWCEKLYDAGYRKQ